MLARSPAFPESLAAGIVVDDAHLVAPRTNVSWFLAPHLRRPLAVLIWGWERLGSWELARAFTVTPAARLRMTTLPAPMTSTRRRPRTPKSSSAGPPAGAAANFGK